MARPMAFNKDEALDQAVGLFWNRGFEATSIRDLTAELGITATSLYNAFGDKQQLFLLALERYCQQRQSAHLAELDLEPSPRRAVVLLFQHAIDAYLSEEDRRGCFLANTALERAPHDPEVAAVVRRGFDDAEKFLARKISQAQAKGEVDKGQNPEVLARGLLAAFLGIRSMVRAGATKSELDSALSGVLGILG